MIGDSTMIVGIDNGLDGGIVFLNETSKRCNVISTHVMPTVGQTGGKGKRAYDVPGMVMLMRKLVPDLSMVFLERAQAMPKQGVSSTFSIGYGFGLWQGILASLEVPYEIVGPRTWQQEMFQGVDSRDTKRASAIIAGRLAPNIDWRATERCRKPHDGLTDALCIAEYGRRKYQKHIT